MDGLKNSIESKDRYFSLLAHDLRSPFHIFLNLSELLSEGIEHLSKSEIIKLSKQLNIALHKQYELLTDLLDWSGIESNQLAFNPETILLYEEVMKVFDSVSALAQEKDIMLSCEVNGDFPVYADPRVLRTLIRNLVSNSIKFTNNGGWVKINASNKGNFVEIVVVDNGVGMDSNVAENLFKSDFHTTTQGTNNEKGTGLGLRFCKKAVEKHNGTIRVESEPYQGSTFLITLPNKNINN
jgi:signal transduction histidine kinase